MAKIPSAHADLRFAPQGWRLLDRSVAMGSSVKMPQRGMPRSTWFLLVLK